MFKKGYTPWNKGIPSGRLGISFTEEARKNMSDAHKGKHLSEETKEKLRISHLGQKAWNKGIPFTEEHKNKLKGRISPMKGKHHSKETREKLSDAHKGRKISEETKQKIREASKNRYHSEETKKKISEILKGHKVSEESKMKMRGRIVSEETRKKLSNSHKGQIPWMKGKHSSEETRRKISEGHIGKPCSEETKEKIRQGHIGKIPWNKGISPSEETRKKLSGTNNHNWRGGISLEPYTVDWTRTLRISIRERDKYTCQICGEKQGDRAFSIYHIDYDKKDCNPDNLITLCISCHIKTNKNRDYWKKYFKERKR